jgi:hypothetical protein
MPPDPIRDVLRVGTRMPRGSVPAGCIGIFRSRVRDEDAAHDLVSFDKWVESHGGSIHRDRAAERHHGKRPRRHNVAPARPAELYYVIPAEAFE